MKNLVGERMNKNNSKDWRERLMENLPFKANDILFVNLPPKVDQLSLRAKGLNSKQIDLEFDDLEG